MKKNWFLRILGVFLILVFIGYVVLYETKLHGYFTSTKIPLAKGDIEAHQVITTNDVYMKAYPNDLLTDEVVTKAQNVVGTRATTFISKNATISKAQVEPKSLRKEGKEHFFSIPSSWLADLPGSLRRLDNVDIWVIKPKSNNAYQTGTEFPSTKPLISNAYVAFIKNAQNLEVMGLTKANDRLNAQSSPAKIELSLTNEQYAKMKKAVENGYLLSLSY